MVSASICVEELCKASLLGEKGSASARLQASAYVKSVVAWSLELVDDLATNPTQLEV